VDRDETAALLAVLVCGALVWVAGALLPLHDTNDEARAWEHLWAPAIPALVPLFGFLGWTVADPEGTETPSLSRIIAVTPFLVVWLRAVVRATRRVFLRADGDALTIGLLRPRVTISARLRASLESRELAAAIAHEEAHARHRDPLRIWLAQILLDVQWPFRRAKARQRNWLRALELARDQEAIRHGAEPTDLASAILAAARLSPVRARDARAALGDDASFLETRLRRLLEPTPPPRARHSRLPALVAVLAVSAFLLGLFVAGPILTIVAGNS